MQVFSQGPTYADLQFPNKGFGLRANAGNRGYNGEQNTEYAAVTPKGQVSVYFRLIHCLFISVIKSKFHRTIPSAVIVELLWVIMRGLVYCKCWFDCMVRPTSAISDIWIAGHIFSSCFHSSMSLFKKIQECRLICNL